ncbi:MAG TPA: metal-dependent transcriptional regulator [Clostridiaceae bacterium]|nr:metal-dependent transcriptional regulator [Clostridiaceae bacterium]
MKQIESTENYLENILILSQKNTIVRSVDLARSMGFSKPSVSRAVHKMKDLGYLKIHSNGHLELTGKGQEKAKAIYERHLFLTQYFMSLGVDETTAANDACRMEHGLSAQTFELMKKHISCCSEGCPADKENCDFDFSAVDVGKNDQ